jgi:hypothetical protein
MFGRLQKKWGVGPVRLTLIFCTFAVGGSACASIARRLMDLLGVEITGWGIVLYIVLVTVLWPFTVLLISVFFGQFRFFTAYLGRMGRRMGLGGRSRIRDGSGSR